MLAEKLGMTVHDMRQRMSSEEYLYWAIYFGRKAQRQELARKESASGSKH